jgi:hypothetical protein
LASHVDVFTRIECVILLRAIKLSMSGPAAVDAVTEITEPFFTSPASLIDDTQAGLT